MNWTNFLGIYALSVGSISIVALAILDDRIGSKPLLWQILLATAVLAGCFAAGLA